jgi:hypothetical protein
MTYYPSICLEGLKHPAKTLSEDSRSPGRKFNKGSPKQEAGKMLARLLLMVSTKLRMYGPKKSTIYWYLFILGKQRLNYGYPFQDE